MLAELVIFAVILVALQAVATVSVGYAMLKVCMSKKFIGNYMNVIMDVTNEVTKEMMEKEEQDL